MKLRGTIPFTGEEITVDLLLWPNAIVWVIVMLSYYWEPAWRAKAVWQYLLWQLGGLPPYCGQ